MAGSNAYAGPAAVVTALRTALATAGTGGVQLQVSYTWPGREAERECVYGGSIGGPHDPAAFRAAGGRRQRREQLSWKLYVRVRDPGLSDEECAQRALAIGALVEEAIAAGTVEDGAGVSGLKSIGVSRFDMGTYADDDSTFCEITYTVDFQSMIT